jgi:hypothetical protein
VVRWALWRRECIHRFRAVAVALHSRPDLAAVAVRRRERLVVRMHPERLPLWRHHPARRFRQRPSVPVPLLFEQLAQTRD